ncbi:hypothetical protein EC968_001296 [Mortierella alpina]|nr:hypothetical protein EC968_001296 [Mortierella alpina]
MLTPRGDVDLDDPPPVFISPIPPLPPTSATTVSTTASTTASRSVVHTSWLPASSTNAACPTASCKPSARVCPPCQDGFVCSLNVIDSSCECPVAKCVKPGFDTGDDPRGVDPPSGSKPSVLAPVLGGIAGLVVVAFIAFLFARRRRQKRRSNTNTLLGQESPVDDAPDPFNHESNNMWRVPSETTPGQKDLIRIAYVPSSNNEKPIQLPELAAQASKAPSAPFMHPFMDDGRNKHDSVASTCSTAVLDEAVVMAVTSKATPQLLRLNTIKANNSEMIQRSNTLHSSNSIKRTQSQRRQAQAKRSASQRSKAGPNQLQSQENVRDQETEDEIQFTPAVMITGPSARSSAQSVASITQRLNIPNMVLEPRPLHRNYSSRRAETTASKRDNEPSTDVLEPATTASSAHSSAVPLAPPAMSPLLSASPLVSTSPVTSSTGATNLELLDTVSERLRPQLVSSDSGSSTPPASSTLQQRNSASTVSTASDTRSTLTRDGEEIMIFWDGPPDSRGSASSSAQRP